MRSLREYLWAGTPDEALRLLLERPARRGAFLGGGTHLAALSDPELEFVVDVSRLGLNDVRSEPAGLRLGALASLQTLAEHAEARRFAGGLLCQAAGRTRTEIWRRQATVAGRLMERDPNDLLWPCLLALDARARVQTVPGASPVSLDLADLPGAAGTSPGLVLEIEVPRPTAGTGAALEWLSRSALDAPLAVVAVCAQVAGQRVRDARIATAGLPAPRRAPRVEAAVRDRAVGAATFAAAQTALLDDIEPRGDHRAGADYRAQLARVLLARALRRACAAT
jgi:carbon-monoxide dehydrogenase medium subunit